MSITLLKKRSKLTIPTRLSVGIILIFMEIIEQEVGEKSSSVKFYET